MKFLLALVAVLRAELSRPARGAWVEIDIYASRCVLAPVSRPARGAWVEIPPRPVRGAELAVAPRKGRVG